jgi:DNA-directed RNA polymerase specialized sigma24 family protein
MGADLGNYGIALLQRGRNDEALPYLERARAMFAERGITELLPQMDALIAQARAGADPAPDVLANLPEPIRQAIAAGDNAAFEAAMEALSEEERRAVIERLQQAGIISLAPQPDQPRPDIDQ